MKTREGHTKDYLENISTATAFRTAPKRDVNDHLRPTYVLGASLLRTSSDVKKVKAVPYAYQAP